jgi:hypothetical protein
LYPYVRFATCGFLIVFTSIVGVGAPTLLSRAVKWPLLASTEISRRAMPSVAERGIVEGEASNIVTVEAPPAAENAPEQPSAAAETQRTATASPELAARNDMTAPEQATPVRPLAAEGQHVAMPAVKTKARLPALKKTARRDQAAKRPSNEALNSVRRSGDTLRDIPVSAYAADGTQRRIVIRPTSIQDVYYYSVPR